MVRISTKKTQACRASREAYPLVVFLLTFMSLACLYFSFVDIAVEELLPDKAVKEPLPLVEKAVEDPLPLVPLGATDLHVREQNCPEEIDFLLYVKKRIARREKGDVPWQLQGLFLNDKWAFYVFCKENGIRVPEIYFCSTDGPESLNNWREPAGLGFVVKVKHGWSSRGVYLMETGFGGREALSGHNMTRSMVIDHLRRKGLRKGQKTFHAEELMKGPTTGEAPPDYKFFVANGEIAYVSIIHHRGTDLACSAKVNEKFERVDVHNGHGCFVRKHEYIPPKPGQCRVSTEVGPIYKRDKLCTQFAKPKEWDKLVATAKKVSRIIGIFVRIDMYTHEGEVVLGEATFLPQNGVEHCNSRLDENGCIDPCDTGRFWKRQNDAFNNPEGGPLLPEPALSKEWKHLSDKEKCERVMKASRSRPQ